MCIKIHINSRNETIFFSICKSFVSPLLYVGVLAKLSFSLQLLLIDSGESLTLFVT